MNCKCYSYNWCIGETKTVVLKKPPFIEHVTDSICIDACIIQTIKHLWKNKIYTLGACCGHNKRCADLVIHPKYTDKEIEGIKGLIKEVDNRTWEINQWRGDNLEVV